MTSPHGILGYSEFFLLGSFRGHAAIIFRISVFGRQIVSVRRFALELVRDLG